jgi:hypothetical protein
MAAEMGPPGPETEHHHHHHTGHRWLDITLAVSAVFISLLSLFLALQHGRVMEKMVEANTWAFVTVGFSDSDYDYTPHVRLIAVNKGVGPAQVVSLEVFYNGVAQAGAHALMNAMLKPSDPSRHQQILQSDVVGAVFSAKEELNFLDFNVKNFTPEEYATITREVSKLTFRVCYCSVLGECSVLDTAKSARPVAVKACSVPKTPFQR